MFLYLFIDSEVERNSAHWCGKISPTCYIPIGVIGKYTALQLQDIRPNLLETNAREGCRSLELEICNCLNRREA